MPATAVCGQLGIDHPIFSVGFAAAAGPELAAAIALGAQCVSLGTRFVASDEAFIPDDWPGVPHRALKARTYEEWDAAGRPPSGARPHEGEPIGFNRSPYREAEIPRYASYMLTPWFEGEVELGPLWAGESVALVHDVRPAGEIVRTIAREADEVLARISGQV